MNLSDGELRDWAASSNRHSNDVCRTMARELLELRGNKDLLGNPGDAFKFKYLQRQVYLLKERVAAAEKVVEACRINTYRGYHFDNIIKALEAYDKVINENLQTNS